MVAFQGRILTGIMTELRRTLTRLSLTEDTRVSNNVCRFVNLLVDKVYSGMLPYSDRQAFEFVF